MEYCRWVGYQPSAREVHWWGCHLKPSGQACCRALPLFVAEFGTSYGCWWKDQDHIPRSRWTCLTGCEPQQFMMMMMMNRRTTVAVTQLTLAETKSIGFKRQTVLWSPVILSLYSLTVVWNICFLWIAKGCIVVYDQQVILFCPLLHVFCCYVQV